MAQYKRIDIADFSNTFVGWNIIDEKHFEDLADRKYYNEYKIHCPNNKIITIIISNYYVRKRVQINLVFNHTYCDWAIDIIGSKQIKKITELEPNGDFLISMNMTNSKFNIYREYLDPSLNNLLFRQIIDFLYN